MQNLRMVKATEAISYDGVTVEAGFTGTVLWMDPEDPTNLLVDFGIASCATSMTLGEDCEWVMAS